MTKLFRAQIDLFTRPVVPIELTGAERQKALALLQALLTEAMTKPSHQMVVSDKKVIGDE